MRRWCHLKFVGPLQLLKVLCEHCCLLMTVDTRGLGLMGYAAMPGEWRSTSRLAYCEVNIEISYLISEYDE